MPDVYIAGDPHRPVTTVTGHFIGMQPIGPLAGAKPETTWYRGDDYAVLQKRIATIEGVADARLAHISDLEKQVALRDAALDIKTGRKPPKRAGEKTHG